ncbi:hypothetical protein BS47DRAFT_1488554 [Hydnum rufescens UP504]|uniref:Pseudouridine synthase I TruA alpha/beta domain-containing protein n=1 Tax=Hydnum rufescens UP504 TaxID=1448309 RepID=A0A9P6ALD8_9AGAM|nr:hypothetical protein BS47DRAFT_1488554 [Hydnum rufescens UP504]
MILMLVLIFCPSPNLPTESVASGSSRTLQKGWESQSLPVTKTRILPQRQRPNSQVYRKALRPMKSNSGKKRSGVPSQQGSSKKKRLEAKDAIVTGQGATDVSAADRDTSGSEVAALPSLDCPSEKPEPVDPRLWVRAQLWATDESSCMRASCLALRRRLYPSFLMASTPYASLSREELIIRLQALEKSRRDPRAQSPDRPGKKPFDFASHPRRKIALRFCYAGWEYNGLAIQDETTPLPTVEEVLFKALAKTRLIDPAAGMEGCGWSRCGRTDRGVSAAGQVVSLWVRSNLGARGVSKPSDNPIDDVGEDSVIQRDEEAGSSVIESTVSPPRPSSQREIRYIHALNLVLPPTIRILAWSPVAPDFDARFSCQYRHYKYIFTTGTSPRHDIAAMRDAAARLVGEHDFRNMCKLDATKQITNYRRTILNATIEPFQQFFDADYGEDSVVHPASDHTGHHAWPLPYDQYTSNAYILIVSSMWLKLSQTTEWPMLSPLSSGIVPSSLRISHGGMTRASQCPQFLYVYPSDPIRPSASPTRNHNDLPIPCKTSNKNERNESSPRKKSPLTKSPSSSENSTPHGPGTSSAPRSHLYSCKPPDRIPSPFLRDAHPLPAPAPSPSPSPSQSNPREGRRRGPSPRRRRKHSGPEDPATAVYDLGGGVYRNEMQYVPLLGRPRGQKAEDINNKWKEGTRGRRVLDKMKRKAEERENARVSKEAEADPKSSLAPRNDLFEPEFEDEDLCPEPDDEFENIPPLRPPFPPHPPAPPPDPVLGPAGPPELCLGCGTSSNRHTGQVPDDLIHGRIHSSWKE